MPVTPKLLYTKHTNPEDFYDIQVIVLDSYFKVKMLLRIFKLIFVTILFGLFVKLFGIPSIERFLSRETFFIDTTIPDDNEELPAVTIRITNLNALQ